MPPAGEYRASALAYELLVQAATTPAILTAADIIHQEWSNSRMGVDAIVGRLRIHRSSFSRRFHSALGVSPVTYLTNLRVQNALSRLKSGRQSVNEIAHSCGWTDPNYFSRCIRNATGLSPKEFRKH